MNNKHISACPSCGGSVSEKKATTFEGTKTLYFCTEHSQVGYWEQPR